LEEFAATVNVGTPVIHADHRCPASHIEASVTAPLALSLPPILRMALNSPRPRRRVRSDLPFNRRPN
jgi:hypothetical protein